MKITLTASKIGPKVLAKHPVWEFLNDDEHPSGDTAMRPVDKIPVERFEGRLFGTIVTLADGSLYPAAISDLSFGPRKYWHHFRSLTLYARGKRFHLAKYFQLWYDSEGPNALAAFLNKKTEEVFPIGYDLSSVADGPAEIVKGTFVAEISDPLPQDKLMKILVGGG
jgi:hypothetical protein